MVRINRVYARTGDGGQTRLVGGQQVSKSDARIEAYGTLDELNAVVGIARLTLDPDEPAQATLCTQLESIQQELFDLGSELATLPEDLSDSVPLVDDGMIERLEQEMDAHNERLPDLKSFVLPGGGMAAAQLHQARTVARRAERRLVSLAANAEVRPVAVRYINRLSDYFFVASRAASLATGAEETLWDPKRHA